TGRAQSVVVAIVRGEVGLTEDSVGQRVGARREGVVVLHYAVVVEVRHIDVVGAVHGHAAGRAKAVIAADQTNLRGRVGLTQNLVRGGIGDKRGFVAEYAIITGIGDVEVACAVHRNGPGTAKALQTDTPMVAIGGSKHCDGLAEHPVGRGSEGK